MGHPTLAHERHDREFKVSTDQFLVTHHYDAAQHVFFHQFLKSAVKPDLTNSV